MNDFLDSLICRHTFDTQALMNSHPPKFYHPNKKLVYDICCPPGCIHRGQLAFCRWYAMPPPEYLSPLEHQTDLSEQKRYFEYEPSQDSTQREWYLNFAHYNLFCAYGGSLFAQDEMQVAEHLVDRDLVPDNSPVKVSALLEKIHAMEFQWGCSDGN